jgi:hypothetical protein
MEVGAGGKSVAAWAAPASNELADISAVAPSKILVLVICLVSLG